MQPAVAPPNKPSLKDFRARALRGGAFLVIRQGLGMVLSLISVLFVTRIIGPSQYGLFAAALGIVLFLSNLGTWGIDVYLLRKTETPSKQEYDQAFSFLLAISVIFIVPILCLQTQIAAAMKMPEVAPILRLLGFYLPLTLLSIPGIVQLDRELRFKRVAYNELISQCANYACAVPMALMGSGAWAPAVGALVQASALLVLTYLGTKYIPRLHWNVRMAREMLHSGLSYSSSIWVWQLRGLVNPLIVGRLGGPQAVGIVAFSIRMTEVLSFAKSATWRVAMAALSKLAGDRDRLRRSIEEGMRLQALAVGLPLALFALLSPWVLPWVFGARWQPALQVFPLIAIGYLCNAMFNLHSSVLYLLHKNLRVTWFHAAHVVLLAAVAAVLVPRYGFIGYGWAEIAALVSYVVIHRYVVAEVRSPNYLAPALWFCVACAAICLSLGTLPFRLAGLALLVVPLLIHRERNTMSNYAKLLFSRGAA